MKPAGSVIGGALTLLLVTSGSSVAVTASGYRSPDTAGRDSAQATAAYGRLPLAFAPQEGQGGAEPRALEGRSGPGPNFLARGRGYGLLVEPTQARLFLRGSDVDPAEVRLSMVGGDRRASLSGRHPLPGRVNQFVGDPSRWRTAVPTYGRVTSSGVYPGIDMAWYGNQGALEYDFVVAPGADPGRIRVAVEGIQGMRLSEDGSLVLDTGTGRLVQYPPAVYQEADGRREVVPAGYVIDGNQVGFHLGAHDPGRTLVIDPVLAYSTYLGGSGSDTGYGIAVDGSGAAIVVGLTTSSNFPTATPVQASYGGSFDAFVSKLNADGSALLYSTYLGGSGADGALGVAVDSTGSAFVTGATGSADFPVLNALQATFGGFEDAFVTKLNAAGSLAYSTYVGGDSSDQGQGIAVDGSGNAYLTGATFSGNFPMMNPIRPARAGEFDAFALKLGAAGSPLLYSTHLGGTASDRGLSVAAAGDGAAVVTGYTFSADFPTANPIQATKRSASDAFVTKVNATGSAFTYSTFLGGNDEDEARDIALDAGGNAYLTGMTESTNFPRVNSLDSALGGPRDAFVTKVNAAGSAYIYSTYLGGSLFTDDPDGGADEGFGIAVDGEGAAHVTGLTESSDFPVVDPLQAAPAGSSDAYVARLNSTGSALVHSTYLGGNSGDEGHDIAVRSGSAYVVGETHSPDATPGAVAFPTTPGAFRTTKPGVYSAFVSRIALGSDAAPPPDFDGDGDTDISVFRPSTGIWYAQSGLATPWGTSGDIPVPGDYDGDGDTDVAVFRPSTGVWYVQGGATIGWGATGDVPVPGDYDGDGDTDVAVFRPSTGVWYVQGGATIVWGATGDVPVPGDYDGNGTTDVVVFRPSTGTWFAQSGAAIGWGTSGDVPVPGDYDGNGTTDVAVFRPSAGVWFVQGGVTTGWGTAGDVPVPGDYDGNGTTDVAVFRPSSGIWYVRGGVPAGFGTAGDIPLPLPSAIRLPYYP